MWQYDPPTPPLPHRRGDEFRADFSRPAAPPPAALGSSAPSAAGRVRCDRCDEAHETSRCPHFKGKRDDHPDAWSSAKGPVKPTRECCAPRALYAEEARVLRMPGDGSCLFHSLAYGLREFGHQEDGDRIRQRIARFMEQRPDFEITNTPLSSWVDWDSRTTVSSYASRLATGNAWGGAIEMAAFAQIFGLDVAVYEHDTHRDRYRRISDFLTDKRPPGAVMVLYLGRSHYDALVRCDAREERGRHHRGSQRFQEEEESGWCQSM